LTDALAAARKKSGPIYVPALERPFGATVDWLSNRGGGVGYGASLMKVFWPYLTWNTVFDNTRVTTEMQRKPAPFSAYSYPLLKFSRENNFAYPYKAWPEAAGSASSGSKAGAAGGSAR